MQVVSKNATSMNPVGRNPSRARRPQCIGSSVLLATRTARSRHAHLGSYRAFKVVRFVGPKGATLTRRLTSDCSTERM